MLLYNCNKEKELKKEVIKMKMTKEDKVFNYLMDNIKIDIDTIERISEQKYDPIITVSVFDDSRKRWCGKITFTGIDSRGSQEERKIVYSAVGAGFLRGLYDLAKNAGIAQN